MHITKYDNGELNSILQNMTHTNSGAVKTGSKRGIWVNATIIAILFLLQFINTINKKVSESQ